MKLNRSYLFLLVALLVTTGLFAQNSNGTVKGTITDAESGEAVMFCNVMAVGTNYGCASDVNGHFSMSLPAGRYVLETTFTGYEKDTQQIEILSGKTISLQIALKSSAIELQEFEITSYSVPLISRDNISSIQMVPAYSASRRSRKKDKGYYATVNEGRTPGTEQYDQINENKFFTAKKEPLSTFSIDVDVASYANVRRFINLGQTPPEDAVRIEEMINYFQYEYPQPVEEDPFSITTEVSDCPWNADHQLVHIGLQGEKIASEELPAQNLVFLLDVSGSMSSYNKLDLVKQSLRLLVNQMRKEDRLSIVVYAGAAGLVLPATSGQHKDKIMAAIEQLSAGGSTAGGQGIELAYKQATKSFIAKGNNRVILCTDGDFNVGLSSDDALVQLIEEKREAGVFLTVLGYGMGNYKDSKMEKLADKGNGNYAYIDNIMEAKKVLVNEMGATLQTIAKDVKLQVEFNPAKVASYRLVGYENRLLNKEDFNDDTKDAGELGAGHTVTALYEIVPTGKAKKSSEKAKEDPLRYQDSKVNEAAIAGNELLTVKFRYKSPKETKSKLITRYLVDESTPIASSSNNFRFSAGVALFGMLLRNSEFVGDGSIDQAIELAKGGKGEDEHGYRAEFIRMAETWELLAAK